MLGVKKIRILVEIFSSYGFRGLHRLSSNIWLNKCVEPRTAGLPTGMEYSRVESSTWICHTSIVSTQIGVKLVGQQECLTWNILE